MQHAMTQHPVLQLIPVNRHTCPARSIYTELLLDRSDMILLLSHTITLSSCTPDLKRGVVAASEPLLSPLSSAIILQIDNVDGQCCFCCPEALFTWHILLTKVAGTWLGYCIHS